MRDIAGTSILSILPSTSDLTPLPFFLTFSNEPSMSIYLSGIRQYTSQAPDFDLCGGPSITVSSELESLSPDAHYAIRRPDPKFL